MDYGIPFVWLSACVVACSYDVDSLIDHFDASQNSAGSGGSADIGSADIGSADIGSADIGSADIGSANDGATDDRTGDNGTADIRHAEEAWDELSPAQDQAHEAGSGGVFGPDPSDVDTADAADRRAHEAEGGAGSATADGADDRSSGEDGRREAQPAEDGARDGNDDRNFPRDGAEDESSLDEGDGHDDGTDGDGPQGEDGPSMNVCALDGSDEADCLGCVRTCCSQSAVECLEGREEVGCPSDARCYAARCSAGNESACRPVCKIALYSDTGRRELSDCMRQSCRARCLQTTAVR